MFSTVDFIQSIVDSMTFTQSISNIIVTADETTFDTCKTYWVFPNYTIKINGNDFKVIDFEINKSITIKGVLIGSETDYIVSAPNFFHGTPLQTAIQLGMISDWENKLPFIYLIQPFTEERPLGNHNLFGRIADLDFLFMLPGKLKDSVDSQYQTAIIPADNMVFEWEKKILIHPDIGELGSARTKDRVNYGVWVTKPGTKQRSRKDKTAKEDNIMRLLNEAISGIEYGLKIPIKRDVCDLDALCK